MQDYADGHGNVRIKATSLSETVRNFSNLIISYGLKFSENSVYSNLFNKSILLNFC